FSTQPPAPPLPRGRRSPSAPSSAPARMAGRSACQPFPHGKAIDQDFPGTMKMLSDAGIQSIELCSPWYSEHNFGFGSLNKITAAEFNRVLSDHNLRCVSSHGDMTEIPPG